MLLLVSTRFRPEVARFRSLVLVSAAVVAGAFGPARAASTWVESSFADFSDGAFFDGGSNLYVSAGGRVQIISRWDLNGDGLVDLVLPSGHGHTEKENTYLYPNDDGHLDARRRIELPGGGSSGGLVADLNGDGRNDLIVANRADSHVKQVDSWIYWGTPTGFAAGHRTALPASDARVVVVGDFNGDTRPDLAFACDWSASGEDEPKDGVSLVYWNVAGAFSVENRSALPLDGDRALALASADIDRDGIDDLVVQAARRVHILRGGREGMSAESGLRSEVGGTVVACADFDGDGWPELAVGQKGAVAVHRIQDARVVDVPTQTIPVSDPRSLCAADLDRDGTLDLIVANFASLGGATWTESQMYLSRNGKFDTGNPISLPTLGASSVSAGDLNGDGYPELVFSNLEVTNERDLLSYVFWNRAGRFRFGDHSQFPTRGAIANTLGDLDNDGDLDVVFFNTEGGFRDGAAETHVYWGTGKRGFSLRPDVVIATHQVFGYGQADLDDDGRMDLILTRENFVAGVNHEQSGITIHWGGVAGFGSTSEITAESSYGGVRVADIDRDGYLDILAGGANTDPRDPSVLGIPIYWGSARGFVLERRAVIPTGKERVRGPLLADIDRDGWLDVVAQLTSGSITIWRGSSRGLDAAVPETVDLGRPDPLMYIQSADLNRDGWLDLVLPRRGPPNGAEVSSLILYGSAAGFRNAARAEVPSFVPYQNSIADFDRDGWLDLALTSYGGEVSGNRPALVYSGGRAGFLRRARTELPSQGSSGSLALDFDGDGWLDLFLANHRQAGSTLYPEPHRHRNDSMLYWGGPGGFTAQRRLDIPGHGPSGLNLRDPGNTYDRGFYEDYVSSAHFIPGSEQLTSVSWDAECEHGTRIAMQVRFATDPGALGKAEWIGPRGKGTWWDKPERFRPRAGAVWIQYRARLWAPNAAGTPYLTRVELSFK